MLNQVFMLDEVIMWNDRAAWQKQQPSKDPADEPESLSASLERAQRVCRDSLATTYVCCGCELGRLE